VDGNVIFVSSSGRVIIIYWIIWNKCFRYCYYSV